MSNGDRKLLYTKGRGAQTNPHNRFFAQQYSVENSYLEYLQAEGEDPTLEEKTKFTKVYPKSIVNKVNSPDLGLTYSMNPYQGCEHGCTYCYARNSHEYWGFSPGKEFEQNILVKPNAAELLEQHLQKKSWEPIPIMLSGNTDCYQPAEKKFEITRKILEVCLKYRQPVGVITKNSLILRDVDLLKELAKFNIVRVSLSVTTLNEELRRKLEPRTASAQKRLKTVEALAKINIPVNIMAAPIIPALNSHEIMDIAKATSNAGASSIGYTVVRLNGQINTIFMDWLDHNFPDRAEKVKHQIEACHGGSLNDSEYGRRMRGKGEVAEQINQMIKLARKKYFNNTNIPPLDGSHFIRAPKGQLGLF